jgi:Zn-dependent M28 family amino/carboxypeptidase
VAVRRLAIAAAVLTVALLVPAPSASAVDDISTGWFRRRVTVGGVMAHARALQRIADRNGGNRAAGTPGYRASVDYVAGRLEAAGYNVNRQELSFPFFEELAPAELQQVSPTTSTYATATFAYSGAGEVIGTLVPTDDVRIPPPSNSGCEPADFVPASSTEPQVALIQRGSCPYRDKVHNAVAAGYDAVVLFNEGQEGRQALVTADLGAPVPVPVVGLSFADGAALHTATQAGPVILRVRTDTRVDLDAKTWNVLADTPGGDPDDVLVVGAHLDSVRDGPGINDNGSGVSVALEVAEELAEGRVRVRQKVRFAFWGAEELGLLGSEHYVDSLSDDELGTIFANLNFDMVGSPNYVRFVFDGDGDVTGTEAPPGSGRIESVFTSYFAARGLPLRTLPFGGRSDDQPFLDVGIPSGGLHSGADLIKTPEDVPVFGGTAGVALDPNYHTAGDTLANLDRQVLHDLGDGVAHAVLTLARSTTGLFEDGSRSTRAPVPTDRPADAPDLHADR